MEKQSDNGQQQTADGDITLNLTDVGLSLCPLIILGIASLVPISFHILAKIIGRNGKSPLSRRVETSFRPTWKTPDRSRFNIECCPICLSTPTLALSTNCGHVYCGPCLRAVWRTSQQHILKPFINCPMCRAKLHEILPVNPEEVLFSTVMMPGSPPSNGNRFLTLYDFVVLFNETYRDVQEPQPLIKRFWKFLVRSLKWAHTLVFRTGFQNPAVGLALSMVTPILYVSEPNNIISNSMPWGYVDDILVILLCALPFINYFIAMHSATRQNT